MRQLLAAFQEYFRENSEHWVERFGYKEAGPQLLLQAFLQGIVNSGGRIAREYGLGRMRTDLLVVWPVSGEGVRPEARQKVVIECKLLHGGLDRTAAQGLRQTCAYMERAGSDEGHLVIFDRTGGAKWDEKIYCREEQAGGQRITVWRMRRPCVEPGGRTCAPVWPIARTSFLECGVKRKIRVESSGVTPSWSRAAGPAPAFRQATPSSIVVLASKNPDHPQRRRQTKIKCRFRRVLPHSARLLGFRRNRYGACPLQNER